ncbi:MAG: alanine racemase [Thermodesulfovibrionales bacterium]|nr:alanine racemase [Thermodesulfovibrionales bacterium]
MHRGTIAEINLQAISENLKTVKKIAKNSKIIGVVKADAYGHGSVEVAHRLTQDGVDYLSVAFSEEAIKLREAGIKIPIIILFDPDPKDIIYYNLTPVIIDQKSAINLSKEAQRRNKKIKVHIKIDTGMGRVGLVADEIKDIAKIANLKGLEIVGVMSHFSDSDAEDNSFALTQIERFKAIRDNLLNIGLNVNIYHMANSAAIISLPQSHFDAVRPGLILYGVSPFNGLSPSQQKTSQEISLIQAMTIKTKLISLRKLPSGTPISYSKTFITKRQSLIGVMAAGYADGFLRIFSNNSHVLVRGLRVPVVGRVCMDLTMIDLTDIAHLVSDEDEVVIMGRQGNEFISASELAHKAGTISYEILTSLGQMATKRVYKH